MKKVIIIFLTIFSTAFTQVQAQETATASAVIDGVYQKERLAQDIKETKRTLLGQLTEYDTLDKRYDISLAQFYNLKTLEALQDAVELGKDTMFLRSQVLTTYLRLLELQLIEVEGAELSLKKEALARIERDKNDLALAQKQIKQIKDREQLNQAADEFVITGENIQQTAAFVNSLLSLSKLQTVYDQSEILVKKIEDKVDNLESALLKARQQSSIKEVKRLKDQTNQDLQVLWLDLVKINQDKHDREQYINFNNGISSEINDIYGQLSQLITYLDEVLANVK